MTSGRPTTNLPSQPGRRKAGRSESVSQPPSRRRERPIGRLDDRKESAHCRPPHGGESSLPLVYTAGRLQCRHGEPCAPISRSPLAPGQSSASSLWPDSTMIPARLDVPGIAIYMARTPSTTCAPTTHPVRSPRRTADQLRPFTSRYSHVLRGRRDARPPPDCDFYAVTAPLVVEAARRLLAGEGAAVGPAPAGSRFSPQGLLGSLAPNT